MIPDPITPFAFDWELLATSLPLLCLGVTIFALRSRRYRRLGADPVRSPRSLRLELVIDAIFMLAVGIAFCVRPLADIFPVQMIGIERLVGPGARIIGDAIGAIVLWQELGMRRRW